MQLAQIQDALRRHKLEGWLFFDHHERDPLCYRILGFHPGKHITRRWYYLVPSSGDPVKLVHRIESDMLDSLPGERNVYSSWQEQHQQLSRLLAGLSQIAMQYSPQCAVLHVANVDAGTIELVRSCGPEVVSSAELVQEFDACLTEAQFTSHVEAGRRVDDVRAAAFHFIRDRIRSGVSELDVRDFVRQRFSDSGLITDSGPIVAVNGHAGNPHYEPTPASNAQINAGDFVLLDMWAKLNRPDSVYYDITWTGFAGTAPSKIQTAFDAVKAARDAGVAFVAESIANGEKISGFQVDDAVRNLFRAKNLEANFVHRTGHSIGTEVHGAGANMDNLETHDERRILPGALFSIEPGLYYDDFGIRLELDMFVTKDSAKPTGEIQEELVNLL